MMSALVGVMVGAMVSVLALEPIRARRVRWGR